jgi:hypothetical protein
MSGNSIYASNGALATVDYYFDVPTNGIYEVYAFNIVSANRATNAPYACFDAYGNVFTNRVNQTLTANTRWLKLGDFLLSPGRKRVVQLSNHGVFSPQLTSADAVMISLNRRLSERPVLTLTGGVTNGALPIRLNGNVGQRFRIESSTDLVNWSAHQNVTMPGAVTNITLSFANEAARYYRAALAP